jgi:acyl-CoA thioester hydrolase
VFVVRGLEIAYDKPARLDDELDASVRVVRLRTASMDIAQEVWRIADDATLARAQVRIACVDGDAFVPRRIPSGIAAMIRQDGS